LLDINNIYVSACNHNFDASVYLRAIPKHLVREMHLAGYEDRGTHLLDTHSRPVTAPVWELFAEAVKLLGDVPVLIEWDNDVPPLAELLQEADKAASIQQDILKA